MSRSAYVKEPDKPLLLRRRSIQLLYGADVKSGDKKRNDLIAKAPKLKFKHAVYFVFCFALAFFLLWRYVQIYETGNYAAKLVHEYEILSGRNQQIRLKIDQAVEAVRLEKLASERLGMTKPEKHQVFYVSTKKDDKIALTGPVIKSSFCATAKRLFANWKSLYVKAIN